MQPAHYEGPLCVGGQRFAPSRPRTAVPVRLRPDGRGKGRSRRSPTPGAIRAWPGIWAAGAYEKIRGRAWFAVDPNAAANATIADIKRAPRDERGLVRFGADFLMLRPVNSSRGNETLLYEVNNRGTIAILAHPGEIRTDLMVRNATGRAFGSQKEAADHYGYSESRYSELSKA